MILSIVNQIACEAGALLHEQFGQVQKINQVEKHDLKLQIDVDCQRLIEARLRKEFPNYSVLGEEESYGDPHAEYRWVVDPLDGTVNYAYGIPHFGVSIGLQRRTSERTPLSDALGGYESVVGVIYDPLRDELFSAEKGAGAFLNGKQLQVSPRADLSDCFCSIGFSKSDATMEKGLASYQYLMKNARKVRTLGSAALDFAYIAAGRMDGYVEFRLRLWDIAAGLVLISEAGGSVSLNPLKEMQFAYQVLATNGKVDLKKILDLDF
jgi:myo-inositol-1(or 4)-monophosphatase